MHGTAATTDHPAAEATARVSAIQGLLAVTAAGAESARRGWASWR